MGIHRRELLGVAGGLVLGGLGTWLAQRLVTSPEPTHPCHQCAPVPPGDGYTPEEALSRLETGNRRFVEGRGQTGPLLPLPTPTLARVYRPYAVVVSCSDARLDCETIFDERMGDLFVIRQPAHLLDAASLGGLEYAVSYLRVPLILVLGHSHCHALASVLSASTQPDAPPAGLEYLSKELTSVVKDSESQTGDPLENLVKANVRRVVRQLRGSPVLRDAMSRRALLRENRLLIQGARCDVLTGAVEMLDLP